MGGIKIKSVREHSEGKWVIQYEVWASCGCSFTRKALVLTQEKLPTQKQILDKINEAKN